MKPHHHRARALLLTAILLCAPTAFAQHNRFARTSFAVPSEPFAMWVDGAKPHLRHLPKGLRWNKDKKLIEGVLSREGTYHFTIGGDTATIIATAHLQQPSPLMGLLTWNVLEADISEQKLQLLADAMADLGLRDAGYRYLCIDDCWAMPERNESGELVPIPEKFPNGMRHLTDYIHAKGLKAGIYSDGGTYTCSHAQPGSLHHEAVDAEHFARWGFDLLKYDFCYSDLAHQGSNGSADTAWAKEVYGRMHRALQEYCSADFIYYICEWGRLAPWQWGTEVGGSCWRATDDTRDAWSRSDYRGSVVDNLHIFTQIWPYSGRSRYSDADMVMCGLHGTGRSSSDGTDRKGMTADEYRSQFVLWCMWASPITLCFDITTLYDGHSRLSDLYNPYWEEDLKLITNRHLIAIDQDPLGLCARPSFTPDSSILILEKPLADGGKALSFTNLSEGLSVCHEYPVARGSKTIDAWTGDVCEISRGLLMVSAIRPHETRVFVITR